MLGARNVYSLLLKLYPARFREEYETPLELQFQDEYREAQSGWARLCVLTRALADLTATVPTQILRELRADLHHALRVHRRSAGLTLLALAALTLAIGATTGIFSVLNALLLRSLPFRDPGRLVELGASPADRSRAGFYEWRNQSPYLEDASVDSRSEMNLDTGSGSAHVYVAQTSSNFFTMLGVRPILGRAFTAEEDVEGRVPVAIISQALWRQLTGGDPRLVGSTIRLNGLPVTIIGVAPPGFDYPPGMMYPQKTAVWTPTVFDEKRRFATVAFRHDPIGRLKPGLSLAQANAMFLAELRRIDPKNRNLNARLTPLREVLAGPVQKASLVLIGIVVFVLLMACANLAHLLLARATERRQELALRASLGASRARLVQQLITESTALTIAASIIGVAVAHWAARLAAAFQPPQLGAQEYTILDWRVFGFVAGLVALTAALSGVLPSWLIGRLQPAQDLVRTRGASACGGGARRMRSLLVAAQAALAVTLVAGAVSLGRSFLKLLATDLGFRTDRIVTLNVSLSGTRRQANRLEREYYREALDRLRAVPGVESAGAVMNSPLVPGTGLSTRFGLEPTSGVGAPAIAASPGYFRSIGMDLVEGREFAPTDRQDSEPVVVVNEALARRLGVASGLVGRKLYSPWGAKQFTVVGVVKTARMAGPSFPSGPDLYYPIEQRPPAFVTFVARVRGRADGYLAACRTVVQGVDPQVPVYDVKTLDQRLSDSMARPRFYTTAILFFSGFALLLAAVGIYGVATHSITERWHEMGVRLAVGASPSHLRSALLWQSLLPLAAGMAVGVAASAGLGKFLKHLMRSAEPVGAWTCSAAALLLMITAALSAWSATSRILRIDPMQILRTE